jgi:hypothetical protein
LTDGTLVPSSSATSAADQASTSRRMSTARWLGGSSCSVVTNASRTESRSSAISAGSAVDGTTRTSGIGCSQAISGSGSGRPSAAGRAGPMSIGSARRDRPSSMSKHTLVAIL